MTTQVYKNLGKYMSYEEKTIKAGMPSKIMIKYTQPNYQDPKKVWEVGVFEDKISEELLDKIVGLSSGEEICVHTVKNDKGYADLHDITDAKDAPSKQAHNKAQYKKGDGNYAPRDDSGIAVGAAWTNALELMKLVDTKYDSAYDAADAAEDLVKYVIKKKLEEEDRLRASKTAKAETKEKAAEVKEEKKPSKLEEMKAKRAAEAKKSAKKKPEPEPEDDLEDSLEEDDLYDINFDEE